MAGLTTLPQNIFSYVIRSYHRSHRQRLPGHYRSARSFIAFDIAVDDYSHGNSITTWVRVRSKKENHIRLSEYLTKGRLLLVEGTLSTSLWKDKEDNPQIQISISADVLKFISTGKRDGASAEVSNPVVAAGDTSTPPDAPQDSNEDLPF